jgi:hypothetical protein
VTALHPPEEGTNKMPKTLSGQILRGSTAVALAIAVSLAAAGSGSAATRHHGQNVRTYQDPPTYYNYAPGQSGLTAGQLGQRTNPTIVPPGAYGPPDPASCGGFHC